ncbi:VanZ family protein [Mesobacillus foraminis]|uniref:VanZ family protein n=1 Tax=Mesobacillus foraminis TaxID=279826 RepID=UPI001BE856E6|nr:VanZ family protein [Mesobacillus foraminis]MBT2757244.1 VanZ family protein [Mesobacillus foraminis]
MLSLLRFKGKQLVLAICYLGFALYIAMAAILLFFSPYRQANRTNDVGAVVTDVNLVPFQTISNYIKASGHINASVWVTNLFGNVLAFMPLGFFLPLLFRRFMKFWPTVILVFVSTLAVECLQLFFHVGSFDIDDIILNTFGGAIGYLFYKAVANISSIVLKGKQ